MMKRGIITLLLLASGFSGFAITDQQLWFAFVHQGKLHKHWGYWIEIQHRTKNQFSNNLHTELFRLGATYIVNKDLRITAGYAGILHFPSLSNQSFLRPEHRPWQQVLYNYTHKNFRLTQYLRSEQRLLRKTSGESLSKGFIFRERLRYSIAGIILFNNKQFNEGSVGLVLNNEVLLNAYAADNAKTFDQNRAFAGLCYQLTSSLQLHLGYLNVYSSTAKANETVHAIRLAAFHNINWVN